VGRGGLGEEGRVGGRCLYLLSMTGWAFGGGAGGLGGRGHDLDVGAFRGVVILEE
jgi:hypothetical protein